MAERPLNRGSADCGYSLIEVLVALVFLTVAALSILQSLGVAASSYSLAQRQWLGALDRWNQTVLLRTAPPPWGDDLVPAPGVPPLRRCVLPGEGAAPDWEVLIARR